jgi:hypothetical protein
MSELLFLNDAALRHEPESLRALLEAHINDTVTATRILTMLLDGAQHGEVKHCVVMRKDSAVNDNYGADNWQIRIVYSDSPTQLQGTSS